MARPKGTGGVTVTDPVTWWNQVQKDMLAMEKRVHEATERFMQAKSAPDRLFRAKVLQELERNATMTLGTFISIAKAVNVAGRECADLEERVWFLHKSILERRLAYLEALWREEEPKVPWGQRGFNPIWKALFQVKAQLKNL